MKKSPKPVKPSFRAGFTSGFTGEIKGEIMRELKSKMVRPLIKPIIQGVTIINPDPRVFMIDTPCPGCRRCKGQECTFATCTFYRIYMEKLTYLQIPKERREKIELKKLGETLGD